MMILAKMADVGTACDLSSLNGDPILQSLTPEICEELLRRIKSLQHRNKILEVELETYKLLEAELEACKMKIEDCS
jgi:hypothetical protein